MTQDASPTDAPTGEMPEVAPSKPLTPRTPLRDRPAPEPFDVDLGGAHIVNPVASPPADEVAPEPAGPFDALPSDPVPAVEAPLTSVQLMGRAAAANASLSASGAPTPLGGIPRVNAGDSTPVDIGDGAPQWAPTFMGAAASTATPQEPVSPAREQAPVPTIALNRHQLGSDLPLYRPRMAGDAPAASVPVFASVHADDAAPTEPGADSAPTSSPRKPGHAWPLVLLGMLTMAGIALALTWPLLHPEAIELPAQRVLTAPAGTAVEPVAPTDPTPFLAAMPLTAGPWALTASMTHDAAADSLLPGRVAEWHTLTYDDGVEPITLDARQLYTEDDAHRALLAGAGADAVLTDATVAGEAVGERAEREEDGTTRIMWTHGSAYFEAVGPSDQVTEFVAALGL